MDWIVQVGQLLLSLSILVVLHEWGHYITARMFKTRVEKFYLFFDFLFPFSNLAKFSIFKFKKGDTEWGLGWFPLGGYVKIAGMADESNDKEALAQPPKPDEFRSKKAWQRLIIILGGIIVNLILGVLIFISTKFVWGDTYIPFSQTTLAITDSTQMQFGFVTGDKVLNYESAPELTRAIVFDGVRTVDIERNGEKKTLTLDETIVKILIKSKGGFFTPRIPFIIGEIPDNSENKFSKLEVGDQIVKIDSIPVNYFDEFAVLIKNYKNTTINLTVLRNNKEEIVPVKVNSDGKIGVAALNKIKDVREKNILPIITKTYSFGEAITSGVRESYEMIATQVKQFKILFDPKTEAYKEVGGIASMGSAFPKHWDWEAFWKMTGFLSLVLAFMNFLPIPMLDGGYMIFILWEMITGKPPGEKFMTIANNVGFAIVMFLMIYANGNDLFKGIMKFFN